MEIKHLFKIGSDQLLSRPRDLKRGLSSGQEKWIQLLSEEYYCSAFRDHPSDQSTMTTQHYVTTLGGIRMPKLIYGTAWKKERTAELVTLAIRKGFRGIDTACQPKHYHEPGVGAALKKLFASNELRREDIFIQTKFTSLDGQDPNNIPYDPDAPLAEQVKQSLEKSLQNLHTSYIDSLVLHSPMDTYKETLQVWRVFESFVQSGKVRQLGISNCYDLSTLTRLWDEVAVKPSVIQNRFYQRLNYDQGIRAFAKKNRIYYQSFWTLTANPNILKLSAMTKIAQKYQKTPEQIFFAYLINSLGLTPLTGTSNETHMKQDLEALNLHLTVDEAAIFNSIVNADKL
ncbi:unnamed protein product [Allacma fusca]|uniref:NADP-dependent oxidoreductase domain-containing protein n=1 Tax=Allacma fusca TaxID=39272 RepID=A0A8J2L067_9HEXA|nr:unnamed protein product [Allacma fusca]